MPSGAEPLPSASPRPPIEAGARPEATSQVSLKLVKADRRQSGRLRFRVPAKIAPESGSLRSPAPLGSELLHCAPQAGSLRSWHPRFAVAPLTLRSPVRSSPHLRVRSCSTALRRPARCAPGTPALRSLRRRSAVRFAPLPAPPVRLVASCVSVNRNAWVAPKGATDRQPTGRPASLQEAGVADQTSTATRPVG